MKEAILLIACPDRVGIIARIAHFVFERGGNILSLDQHADPETGMFFARFRWDLSALSIHPADLSEAFAPLAKEFRADWKLELLTPRCSRLILFVSKYAHCLNDLVWRQREGELKGEIVAVISNHPDLESHCTQYGLPFHHIPVTPATKASAETEQRKLIDHYGANLIVLARYMQILSAGFVNAYPAQIINIHHSFLPAFIGGNPYRQARDRGVKIIGATSHYATEDLDEGPIIEQDIIRISHRDSLEELVCKGRDLEKVVLARAVRAHLERRILVHGHKTIVFG